MSRIPAQRSPETGNRLSGRMITGMIAAVLLVVFVLVNRDQVDVTFVVWSAVLPLWVALALAGILGAAAGFLISRRRYRR